MDCFPLSEVVIVRRARTPTLTLPRERGREAFEDLPRKGGRGAIVRTLPAKRRKYYCEPSPLRGQGSRNENASHRTRRLGLHGQGARPRLPQRERGIPPAGPTFARAPRRCD